MHQTNSMNLRYKEDYNNKITLRHVIPFNVEQMQKQSNKKLVQITLCDPEMGSHNESYYTYLKNKGCQEGNTGCLWPAMSP